MPSNAIKKIILVAKDLQCFWSKSHGWAPDEAAILLSKARLDRLLSFATMLEDYLVPFPSDSAEARQILGYTTLRSLCEGALMLFFSIYLKSYLTGEDVIYNDKNKIISPEKIDFDNLILLYLKHGDKSFEPFLDVYNNVETRFTILETAKLELRRI